MQRLSLLFFCIFSSSLWSKALVDPDVEFLINKECKQSYHSDRDVCVNKNILIFLVKKSLGTQLIKDFANYTDIKFQSYHSLPVIVATGSIDNVFLKALSQHPAVAQLSLLGSSHEELEVTEQAILLRPSETYPLVNNWWAHGYSGKGGIIGILDSGIATDHPSLKDKKIYVRKEIGSQYEVFKNGVRSPHGTGVACIYSGMGSELFPKDLGIAYGASKIISGLSGESVDKAKEIVQTISTLDWMLDRAPERPNIINYSIGHNLSGLDNAPDWSGLGRIVDYVINHYHILWVKSAGNNGFVESQNGSSMTVPADNYNGLTIANMNSSMTEETTNLYGFPQPNRRFHAIYPTSSRGPTKAGRKKPDITAPGNQTWTCAPDPSIYPFEYTESMNYHDGYRFMGGTSAATPHVGAATLLLHQAGITNPMAQKALLINSADAWTDNNLPGPDDPKHPTKGKHYPVMGSEWNRTYGWGYLNMQSAYQQRHYLKIDALTPDAPIKSYTVHLSVGAKITLVHERRVGYHSDGTPWKLSHLKLEIFDKNSQQLLFSDNSKIDTVHQVSNCTRSFGEAVCTNQKSVDALVKVTLMDTTIDGSDNEPYALSFSEPAISAF
ncbi:MAG: S8 family serine peptidase [Legionella sp.]|nr:S8 family serine peptidase [Legionella sp.]